jgi:hypothetical protein
MNKIWDPVIEAWLHATRWRVNWRWCLRALAAGVR